MESGTKLGAESYLSGQRWALSITQRANSLKILTNKFNNPCGCSLKHSVDSFGDGHREVFRRAGSAVSATCSYRGHKGDTVWAGLEHSRVLRILHNPRYTGAFVYGRTHTRKTVHGDCVIERMPEEECECSSGTSTPAISPVTSMSGISGTSETTAKPMELTAQESTARRTCVVASVVALRVLRQTYDGPLSQSARRLSPDYVCQRQGIENVEPICQRIPGSNIDEAVGNILVEAVTPVTLEVALAVQQELQSRREETDRLRQQQVDRSRYEAELAGRRYLRVDPDNRLVADSLEADWNAKLKMLSEAQELCERQREQDRNVVNDQQQAAILSLASSFPQLLRNPATPDRERKRIVRLLLEDVTLIRGDAITLHLRFKGGAHRTLQLPLPLRAWSSGKPARSYRGDRSPARTPHLPGDRHQTQPVRHELREASRSRPDRSRNPSSIRAKVPLRPTARQRPPHAARDCPGSRSLNHPRQGLVASRTSERSSNS